ncbi:hypothetical protein [Thalassotalea sp. LPB0316]|nr:hypothetical protein [Thalassotalea sp. LPB0316]
MTQYTEAVITAEHYTTVITAEYYTTVITADAVISRINVMPMN